MNICVFCSAQKVPEQYRESARDLGARIARGGHTLIWGGTNRGLMKIVADSAQEHGARLVGISMEIIKGKARKNLDELVVAKDLCERKRIMLERSDVFIVLPGGIGTLDEMAEMIELKRHRVHHKPLVLLNVGNFYDGIQAQLETMDREGFFGDLGKDVVEGVEHLIHFNVTPEEAMRYIESYGN